MGFFGLQPSVTDVIPVDPRNNDASTFETIGKMIALAKDAAFRPNINHVVHSLLCNLHRPTQTDLARAIWYWVHSHIKFKEDEDTLVHEMGWSDPFQELLISPEILVQMPIPEGDCDDFSMLVASLCIAARVPCWFVAVAVDSHEPDRWSHVYVRCFVDGKFLCMDASHGTFPGWETDRKKFRKMEWKVN